MTDPHDRAAETVARAQREEAEADAAGALARAASRFAAAALEAAPADEANDLRGMLAEAAALIVTVRLPVPRRPEPVAVACAVQREDGSTEPFCVVRLAPADD
jgi:uncharacterized membrane protein